MVTIEQQKLICSYCGGKPYPTREAFSHHWNRCPTRIRAGYIEVPLDMIPAELERLHKEAAELEEQRKALLDEANELQTRLTESQRPKKAERAPRNSEPANQTEAQVFEKLPGDPMYLVMLEGGRDVLVKLVPEAVWQWIHLPYAGDKPVLKERVPKTVLAEAKRYGRLDAFRKVVLSVTSGSFANDRAIAAPGLSFDDIEDATKYAKTNKVPILETYKGCIY